MKRLSALLAAAVILLNISACGAESRTDAQSVASSAVSTKEETVAPEELHSEYYDERYTLEQVYEYFSEVVLSSEYGDEENGALVQKWILPIFYTVEGDCTDEDYAVITDFVSQLNEVSGFPKMYPAENDRVPSITLSFMDSEELDRTLGGSVDHERSDGISQYWYLTEFNVIFEARIGYDKDMPDSVRTSVLLEEIINAIGLSNDSALREDSIIYSDYTEATELSDMDWLIIRLLYSKEIKCGMDADRCYEALKTIYY